MNHIVSVPLLCCLLLACAPAVQETDVDVEHTQSAGARGYMEATLFCPGADGRLKTEHKLLPWQSNMEGYALSFVLSDPAVTYSVATENGLAHVDVQSFPEHENAAAEAAAVAGIVQTMLAFPNVNEVALTFDGEMLDSLPHGAAVEGIFSEPIVMDETG